MTNGERGKNHDTAERHVAINAVAHGGSDPDENPRDRESVPKWGAVSPTLRGTSVVVSVKGTLEQE